MRTPIAALTLALFLPVASSQAGVIHACVAKASGKIRVVATPGMCKAAETAIDWNEAGPAASSLKLVGFTTATILGGAGIFEWTRACSAEFTSARVCQVGELVVDASPRAIFSPEDFAWVLPNNGQSGALTGVTPNGGITCAASDGSGASGLVVNGHGFFGFRVCSEAHRVACCAPSN